MANESVLDSELTSNEQFIEIIAWWEKKRLVYNLIVLSVQILMMVLCAKATIAFGIIESIFWSGAYLIAANGFYTAGWALEIFASYYNIKFIPLARFRSLIFLSGILFSALLTFVLYHEALVGSLAEFL